MTLWTRSFKPENQDAGGCGDGYLVVVDGATPIDGDPTTAHDTHRFAQLFVRELDKVAPQPLTLVESVEAALTATQIALGNCGVTATLSCAAWDKDIIRTISLGDSAILLDNGDEVAVVRDPEFVGRETGFLSQVSADIAAGMPAAEAYARVGTQLAYDRSVRNTDEGVWVLSDGTPARDILSNAFVYDVPRQGMRRIAAVTDGAMAYVETFSLTTLSGLFDAAEDASIDRLSQRALEIEDSDPERQNFLRFSPKDDATIVVANLS